MKLKVYFASHVRHAPKWLVIRDGAWGEHIRVMSTWIEKSGLGKEETLSLNENESNWKRNIDQISLCDVLVVYAEPEDMLRGALIEVGAALSWEIPVLAWGTDGNHHDPRFGSWQYHPLVVRLQTEEQIRAQLLLLYDTKCDAARNRVPRSG